MWNPAYSEQDQKRAESWWDPLRAIHSEVATRTLIEMMIAKEKWGVQYSEEQEKVIAKAQQVLFTRQ